MIDSFVHIPGPQFLLIFFHYAAFIIILLRLLVNNDDTVNREVVEPTKLSPLEIAILKNGYKGAVNSAIFKLWQSNSIDIVEDKGKGVRLSKLSEEPNSPGALEESIWNFLNDYEYLRDFFQGTVKEQLEKVIQPNVDQLKKFNLLATDEIKKRYWSFFYYGVIALLVMALPKLYFGIVRDKPVLFLIALLLISLFVLYQVIKPGKVFHSALGKKVLSLAEKRFQHLKRSPGAARVSNNEYLLYGVALFGITLFLPGDLMAGFSNPTIFDGGSVSSGCSSGCSSCSGGCSGGCGGGCGGCGD